MPDFNRRRFLQIASCAGLAPALPAFPVRAAAATRGVTSAQMLWASLYANAGNAKPAQGMASRMGISTHAAQSVYAKLVETNVMAVHGVTRLSQAARSLPVAHKTVAPKTPRPTEVDLERLFSDEVADDVDLEVSDDPSEEVIMRPVD